MFGFDVMWFRFFFVPQFVSLTGFSPKQTAHIVVSMVRKEKMYLVHGWLCRYAQLCFVISVLA